MSEVSPSPARPSSPTRSSWGRGVLLCAGAGAVALIATVALGGCSSTVSIEHDAARQALADEVSPERLMELVTRLSDAHLADTPTDCSGWDVTYAPDCHHTRVRAGQVMQAELEALGYTVTRHDSNVAGFETSNLVAELKGETLPDEVVLVAAHYDAFYGGADDNSSGVAAVLEMARVLASRKFERTIRFVGFDLEELGLVGSTRYVNDQLALSRQKPVGALVFDCIGFSDDAPGSQGSLPAFPTPEQGNFIAVMSNSVSHDMAAEMLAINDVHGVMEAVGVSVPEAGVYPLTGNLLRSDHAPFWLAGMPALFLTDTANFRNPNYHTDTDLPATVNPTFLANVVRLSTMTVAQWAGGPR